MNVSYASKFVIRARQGSTNCSHSRKAESGYFLPLQTIMKLMLYG
jgi:hypothetical protein